MEVKDVDLRPLSSASVPYSLRIGISCTYTVRVQLPEALVGSFDHQFFGRRSRHEATSVLGIDDKAGSGTCLA